MTKSNSLFSIICICLITLITACSREHDPLDAPIPVEATETITTVLPTGIKTTVDLPISTLEPEKPETTQISPKKNEIPAVYDLNVKFDYGLQKAFVNEEIKYVNNTASLALTDLMFAVDVLRTPGVFTLVELLVNDKKVEDYVIGPYWINVPLATQLLPGESTRLMLTYELDLPEIPPPADDRKPTILGYTSLQTNFVDWYPFIPPLLDDGGWILHEPWFYGEYLVYDLSDFNIQIELSNAPEGLLIASGAGPLMFENGVYSGSMDKSRNLVWSISPSYLVSSAEFEGTTIYSYYFPFHQSAGEHALSETLKAVALYSELFGEYPRKTLTIIEADFLDGMEYDSLYFLSRGFYNLYDGTPQGYLTAIAVHETAHQWWYTQIANDQALEPWLDEALCTYSELLFYENEYPELIDWWWEFRVNFYNPTGAIDRPIYDYQGFTAYRDATYLRGAQFMQDLRTRMGDDLFFDFFQNYTQEYRGKIVTANQFWLLLDQLYLENSADLMGTYFSD